MFVSQALEPLGRLRKAAFRAFPAANGWIFGNASKICENRFNRTRALTIVACTQPPSFSFLRYHLALALIAIQLVPEVLDGPCRLGATRPSGLCSLPPQLSSTTMGNDSSKTSSAEASASTPRIDSARRVVLSEVTSPLFIVEPSHPSPDIPPILALRVDSEALAVVDPETGAVLRAWPYHRILCWGYTGTTFQWKVFQAKPALSPASPRQPGSPLRPPSTRDRGPIDIALAVDVNISAPSTAPPSPVVVADSSPPSAAAGPDIMAAVSAPAALPANIEPESVETMIARTPNGAGIEAEVMLAVRRLMKDMSSRGVTDEELNTLLATLNSLTEEGNADQVLSMIRQLAVTRAFDIRQAVQLVQAVGAISPFDQVEAAVILYSSVMNKESFPLVLGCFDDAADRDNICHRLGIAIDDAGRILATTSKSASSSRGAR